LIGQLSGAGTFYRVTIMEVTNCLQNTVTVTTKELPTRGPVTNCPMKFNQVTKSTCLESNWFTS